MEFRVLGSLEVLSDGVVVPIAGRLHPRILAGLLLNAGRTVSMSWLVDLLWDDDPPATAQRQVQNAVAALRRRLEPVRTGLIERIGREYRVNIGDDELDLRRFERLSREARRFAEDGRWAEAFDGFRAALGLWRGSALQGMPGRILNDTAARLDDKRLSVFEECSEAALTAGGAQALLSELWKLVAANPLRQRLHGRLMHTLYQSGKAAEAIRVFESLSKRLADKLGLDPDEQLKQLHIQIHQADPSLMPIATRPKHLAVQQWRRPVPAELPTDVASFTGREEQLALLDRLRDSGARAGVISAITGIGGVGKTALAVHWGHSRRDDFPDGQLYINLRGFDEREPLTPHEGVSRMLRSLGHPANDVPTNLEKATHLYRALLTDRRMLIVIDNARTAEQVRPLLPESFGNLAIVTSRNSLSSLFESHVTEPVKLGTLSPGESLNLLIELIGRDASENTQDAQKLASLCGHLPLALRIAASNHIQNYDKELSELTAELEGASRLSQLNIDDDAATDLTAVFDLSHRTLSYESRSIFRFLGLIPGDDFAIDLAASIANISESTCSAIFSDLTKAHLLEQYEPGRFRFHDLIRLYARKLATEQLDDKVQAKAIIQLIAWYSDRTEPRFREFANIVAVCEAYPDHRDLWKIVRLFRQFTSAGNDLNVMLEKTEDALEKATARQDIDAKLDILLTLGSVHEAKGDSNKGLEICEEAAALRHLTDNIEIHGFILATLSQMLYMRGQFATATDLLVESLQEAETSGDRTSIAIRSANLGRCYRQMGQFHKAIDYLQYAKSFAEEDNHTVLATSMTMSLGNIYGHLGHLDEALSMVQRALNSSYEIKATRLTALSSLYTGVILSAKEDYVEAMKHIEEAINISRREKRTSIHIESLEHQTQLFLRIGDHLRAGKQLALAEHLSKDGPPNPVQVSEHSRLRCCVYTAAGAFTNAIAAGIQACRVFREDCQAPHYLARSLDALAQAHHGAGNHAEAETAWTEAHEIFARLGVPEAAAVAARLDAARST